MSFLKKIMLTVVLMTLFCMPVHYSYAEVTGDSVIAKVGNLEITAFDVNRELQQILPMQVSFHGGLSKEKMDKLKSEALQTLIDRAYKVQYAISEEIAVDPEVMNSEWQAFSSRYSESLSKMPSENVAAYKADIYRKLLAMKAEKLVVDQNVSITDEEVRSFYESNKEKYFRPKSFTASHIVVKIDPTENDEARQAREKRVMDLLARAQSGEDFYNLAYYESEDRSKYVGGSLGTFHANQVMPAFREAIEKMSPGEISGPVKTEFGYHIVKLDSVDKARQLTFDEVSSKIRTMLESDEREELYNEWMSSIKDKFPLQRFDN